MSNGKTIREAMKAAGKTPEKPNPYKHDVIYDPRGQWAFPGQVTKIPSSNITMSGVPYPVYGEDNLGYGQMMYPGMDYTFPGQYVTEYPMAAYGGDPSLPNITGHYQKGGRAPIYVEDPNDPRLKAYNDSLRLYKQGELDKKQYVEFVKNNGFDVNRIKEWSSNGLINPDKNKKIGTISNGILTNHGGGFDRNPNNFNDIKYFDYYPVNNNKDVKIYSDTEIGRKLSKRYENYKKPVQPVIYKKPVQPVIYQKPEEVITPDYLPMIQTGMPDMVSREPEIIASPTSRPSSTNNRIAWRMDPETRKMVPVYLEGRTQKVKEGKRLYNKNIPSSTAAIPADFVPQFEPDGNKDVVSKKMGGWLDTMQEGGTKPWGEMTPKERAAYLDAKEANKKAETKSRAQAKKEHINDYVINSTKKALTHPMFSAPAYLTPQGAMIGAGQSVINASRNIYDGNYKTAAFDALGVLGVLPLLKQLKNIPKSFKPNIKGKFEGVGSTDDVKQLSAKPTYENNPYTFRDPQSNQPIYQTDPADFQNFKNSEMINEAKTHYKNAINKWLNTEGVKRSGHTDVPEFNDELKYIKDQAQYGKRPLLNKNNIGTSKEYDIYRNNLEQWKKNTNQQEEGIFDFFNKNKEDLTDPEMLKIFPKPQPKNFYIKGDEKRSAFVAANELTNKEVPEAVKYFNNPDKEKVVSWMKTGDPKDVIREMNPRKYKNLDQMNNQQLEKARQEVYNDFINSWKNSLKNELSNTYTGKQAFNELTPNKFGGESDDEEYRRGGSVNPLMRSRSKRASTKKNIQSSINKIFLRNYDLFGPGGKNIYDPKAKYEEGGLYKYQVGAATTYQGVHQNPVEYEQKVNARIKHIHEKLKTSDKPFVVYDDMVYSNPYADPTRNEFLMPDNQGGYTSSGVTPFDLILAAPQQVIKTVSNVAKLSNIGAAAKDLATKTIKPLIEKTVSKIPRGPAVLGQLAKRNVKTNPAVVKQAENVDAAVDNLDDVLARAFPENVIMNDIDHIGKQPPPAKKVTVPQSTSTNIIQGEDEALDKLNDIDWANWETKYQGKNIAKTGNFNRGVFEIEGHPEFLAKIEEPGAHMADIDLVGDDYLKLNFPELYKNITSPNVGKVVKQMPHPTNPNQRILIMKKVSGKGLSELSPSQIRRIPDESFLQLDKDLRELRNKGLAADFVGDNILYNAKDKSFKIIDLSPTKTTMGPTMREHWADNVIRGVDQSLPKEQTAARIRKAIMDKLMDATENSVKTSSHDIGWLTHMLDYAPNEYEWLKLHKQIDQAHTLHQPTRTDPYQAKAFEEFQKQFQRIFDKLKVQPVERFGGQKGWLDNLD